VTMDLPVAWLADRTSWTVRSWVVCCCASSSTGNVSSR